MFPEEAALLFSRQTNLYNKLPMPDLDSFYYLPLGIMDLACILNNILMTLNFNGGVEASTYCVHTDADNSSFQWKKDPSLIS